MRYRSSREIVSSGLLKVEGLPPRVDGFAESEEEPVDPVKELAQLLGDLVIRELQVEPVQEFVHLRERESGPGQPRVRQ